MKEGKRQYTIAVDLDEMDLEQLGLVSRIIRVSKEAPPDPELAEVFDTDDPKVQRFERKFIKDLRAMLEGHKQKNMAQYVAAMKESIRRRKNILLKEKLRRLELEVAARQRDRELKGPDLFAAHHGGSK